MNNCTVKSQNEKQYTLQLAERFVWPFLRSKEGFSDQMTPEEEMRFMKILIGTAIEQSECTEEAVEAIGQLLEEYGWTSNAMRQEEEEPKKEAEQQSSKESCQQAQSQSLVFIDAEALNELVHFVEFHPSIGAELRNRTYCIPVKEFERLISLDVDPAQMRMRLNRLELDVIYLDPPNGALPWLSFPPKRDYFREHLLVKHIFWLISMYPNAEVRIDLYDKVAEHIYREEVAFRLKSGTTTSGSVHNSK